MIPNKLKFDKTSNLMKLRIKKIQLMNNFRYNFGKPNTAWKESAKMIIMEIPAPNKSMENVKTTIAWTKSPKQYLAISP
ncbi:hypothetical protein WICPIJ_002902 [Wickerhamomyces pijperi]|uniref:Uncharacterized protein n=1 Tax=Wickerhamomyces pijperi TaxID=599730 RepID=A0A9P8TNH9_WICPI|nr:hypothetical protein WICPIJ_002902 [Wickerhamomyces pijperi]